jgi:hypothetical protein
VYRNQGTTTSPSTPSTNPTPHWGLGCRAEEGILFGLGRSLGPWSWL